MPFKILMLDTDLKTAILMHIIKNIVGGTGASIAELLENHPRKLPNDLALA